MRKIALSVGVIVALSGVAGARPYDEPAYVPPQKLVAGLSAEWLTGGGFFYSASDGTGSAGADDTYGFAGELGWELVDRIEIGIAPRYIAHEHFAGEGGTGSELDVLARVALHVRPYEELDVSFAAGLGYSHVFLPSSQGLPDPTGPVSDFAVSAAYPVGSGLWGTATFGYQRGFQDTTIMTHGLIPMTEGADFTTDFAHLGVGLAYRF